MYQGLRLVCTTARATLPNTSIHSNNTIQYVDLGCQDCSYENNVLGTQKCQQCGQDEEKIEEVPSVGLVVDEDAQENESVRSEISDIYNTDNELDDSIKTTVNALDARYHSATKKSVCWKRSSIGKKDLLRKVKR